MARVSSRAPAAVALSVPRSAHADEAVEVLVVWVIGVARGPARGPSLLDLPLAHSGVGMRQPDEFFNIVTFIFQDLIMSHLA